MQYIEAVYSRFDVNTDGNLDYAESKLALPVFSQTLKKIAHCTQGTELTDVETGALFTYLLSHGKIPTNLEAAVWLGEQDVGDALRKFLHFVKLGEFEAPRIRILQIFAEIGKAGTGTSTDPSCLSP